MINRFSPVQFRLTPVNIFELHHKCSFTGYDCGQIWFCPLNFLLCINLIPRVRRCLTISNNKELQINEEIRDKEVRVIDTDGSQLGVMATSEALKKAAEKNLDLVKIAPQAVPPVCKIIDFGKYRYEIARREKEAKKNQKVVEVKEIRLSLNIDTHDFNTKVNQAKKFIAEGNKVKASIRFRGREMGRPELGLVNMNDFQQALADVAVVEKPAKLEGRSMLMFLAPKPVK